MSGKRVSRSVLSTFVALLALAVGPIYALPGARSITALALDPQTPTLYAGTSDGGVFKSTDGGISWSSTGLTSGPIQALVIDPLTPNNVYAAISNVGIVKTTDGGLTWSATGLSNGLVRRLAIDPQSPTTLYAVLPESGVFKSTDGGETWHAALRIEWLFYQNPTLQAFAIDPQMPTTVYVGVVFITSEMVWVSVLKSSDGGWSWCVNDLNFYAESLNVLAIEPRSEPLAPATLYAGVDNYGLFKSTDGGASWTTTGLTDFFGQTSIGDLVIDPHRSTTLYTGLTSGWMPPSMSALKSLDAGDSWAPSDTGLADTIRAFGLSLDIAALVIDPVTSTTLYAGTAIGVFKSIDAGENWRPTALIDHSPLASVTLDSASVLGGEPSTGMVTLVSAQSADVTVALSSTNPVVATVPSSMTVPAGSTSATFTVSTSLVSAATGVTISASLDGATRSADMAVYAPTTLSHVWWLAHSMAGGTATRGRVVLSRAPVPAGDLVVMLTSSNPAVASVPASVTVPTDATYADFTISSTSVVAATSVTISATYGTTKSAAVIVTPPPVALIGQRTNVGRGGSYRGRFAVPVNPQNITIRSTACGSTAAYVTSR